MLKEGKSKIRVLYVNNYACSYNDYLRVKNLEYPSNHLWGIAELIDKGYDIRFADNLDASVLYKHGLKNIPAKAWFHIRLYLKYKKHGCNVVYASYDKMIIFFAFLKKMRLCRAKLIQAIHHRLKVKNEKYYKDIIYISHDIFAKRRNLLRAKYTFWGPDINFFDHWNKMSPSDKTDGDITFVSNGKTRRDNTLFIHAISNLPAKAVIISDEIKIPDHLQADNKITVITSCINGKNAISDQENIQILKQSHVMVLPVIPGNNTLCGLTSFLDALAMGMPIIVADNAMIGIDVEAEGFGFFYKSGDMADLKEKMKLFCHNPALIETMGKRARAFAEEHPFSRFADAIEKAIIK